MQLNHVRKVFKFMIRSNLIFGLIKVGSIRLMEIYWARMDARRLHSKVMVKSGLFVDAGSNLGQGFRFFSRYYDSQYWDFHLFEPNPNCHTYLEDIVAAQGGKIILHKMGVGAKAGKFAFFGISEVEGGSLSEGGSIIPNHGAKFYTPCPDKAIDVSIIEFKAFLRDMSARYDTIVVKMDIEGAELDLLEDLIETGAHKLIDTLYVEFHSQYMFEPERTETKRREENIISALRQDRVRGRLWH